MTTRRFQCKLAVASGQDREPISLEQFPDEILFMHIVFNKQNYHRVHINLFNGLRASKEIFCDIAATSLKIRDLNFADCIVAPGLRGRNRSIPMESTCNGKENPEGLLRNVGLVCALPKLEIPTNYMAAWRPALRQSEPPESHLVVRQSRGTVTVPHGCQHEPNVRHRSIQLIRNRMVNIS